MTHPTAMAPDASTSPVDWSRPIEAVHPTKDTLSVSIVENDGGNMPWHLKFPTGEHMWSFPDGDTGTSWRIRNVQSTTPELDPALWDRMVASHRALLAEVEAEQCEHEQTHRGGAIWTICDDCGEKWADDRGGFQPYAAPDWLVEAREIAALADLPKPVDPDEEIARDLVRAAYPEMKPGYAGRRYQIALAAIKRGRALAGEQA